MGKVREDKAHTLKLNQDWVALNLEKQILSLIERMEDICHELWHLHVHEFSDQQEEDFETVFEELQRKFDKFVERAEILDIPIYDASCLVFFPDEHAGN